MAKQKRIGMNNPFLVGKKIYLRSLEVEDVQGEYVSWLNDEEVCRYNSHHVFPYTRELAVDYIQKVNGSDKNLVLSIILKKGSEHIGNISLQNISWLNRSAELAILIGNKTAWGKGLGMEACNLLVEHGFTQLGLNRIYLGTNVKNVGMRKIAEKLGMKKEGLRRNAVFCMGKFVDVVEYGLLRKEWRER